VIRLSGRLRSALIIGGQGIRARKTRTLLSIISLFLGVLAVVVVQAGAEAANRSALADIELTMGKDGTMQMYLPVGPDTVTAVLDTFHGRTDAVAVFGGHAVIGEPGVRPLNPGGSPFDQAEQGGWGPPPGSYMVCDKSGVCRMEQSQAGEQAPPGQAIELGLTGLSGDVRPFRPYRLQSGQWLDFTGPPSLSPRIVVNKEAAKGFNRYRIPAQMHLDGATSDVTPRIIGVIDDGVPRPMAYARADELLNWMPPASVANYGGVQALMNADADDVVRTLRAKLSANGRMSPQELRPEVIQARAQIAGRLAMYRWIFLGIAGLVLLVGVAGILNVGLATVGERVEEFALRRAVGTPRSLLAGIVLAETLLTGLFTAAAAIGAAALCLKVASGLLAGRFQFLADMQFPWQAGVAGVIAGLVAGLIGGAIPALRAARIPIATVMRA
jgi:putative ABC transport system permease protein